MTNRTFMTVEEVAAELGVSKSYAYKIVKQLNEELQKLGYLTVAGRVNTNYFRKKCIFRKNCASVPEERSAIPLQTEQSSAG